ncbi:MULTISPECIES: hypothetical protein [unclassified Pseudomonas]|jgi:hypothetical protein|uniref:hypothetical protein n=1 Tax=unclassified Pseudomonas TaxID=196821 RepID=UPI0004694FCF|nr:hypothetical protein [Pseudomonas sp. H1h]
MPIVFVHGVNNRKEDVDYEPSRARIEQSLRSILAPDLGIDTKVLSVSFPYWGGDGVKFRWNQASLPSSKTIVKALSLKLTGLQAAEYELWIQEVQTQNGGKPVVLGDISRQDKGFAKAVDLVWDAASIVAQTKEEYREVLKRYEASRKYAANIPAWAIQQPPLTNRQFIDKLNQEIAPLLSAQGALAVQTMGFKDWWASLGEAVNRLGSAPNDAVTALALARARESLHTKATRFLGDIFVYLNSHQGANAPGAIVNVVMDALRKADEDRKPGDDKLIIIGHSLGGVILYDILTYFDTNIKVDLFATIGSQIAVFEEMTLYRASQQGVPANPPKDLLNTPANVEKWVNIFDTNDIFSFRAEGVFNGVKDYKFDTGYGLLEAHGGYFARPSFYKRLAVCLKGK